MPVFDPQQAADPTPVFVSGTGRRRQVLRWSGIAVAILLAGYLLVVGSALITKVETPRAKPPGQSDDRRQPDTRTGSTAW